MNMNNKHVKINYKYLDQLIKLHWCTF